MKNFMEAILVMGIIWLCKFIDWREQREQGEQRYPAFEQDW
jgi:hypothetical protein